MKLIARTFAMVGFLVILFASCGSLGIGHFRVSYGPAPVVCEAAHAEK